MFWSVSVFVASYAFFHVVFRLLPKKKLSNECHAFLHFLAPVLSEKVFHPVPLTFWSISRGLHGIDCLVR